MLRSCPYCGRIHDSRFDCGKRPVQKKFYPKKRGAADLFRSTKEWQRTREMVRARDRNLCRWCLSRGMLSYDKLSVHHIEPLEQAWELRSEEDNLITLCPICHEMAESGKIPRDALKRLAQEPPRLSPPLPRNGKKW